MLGDVVGDLDLLGNSVTACDGGFAGSKGRAIYALASSSGVCLESVAGEPVGSLASRVLAVWVDAAALAGDISAVECASFETCFGGLLLVLSRDVARREELVDELLVLADAVGEHASVVAVVVDTPLPAIRQNNWPTRAFNGSLTHRQSVPGCKSLPERFPRRCRAYCNRY